MFNPSFCQELVKRRSSQRHPVFPSGTNGILVGDKRGSRWGQMNSSLGTNGRFIGDKRQPIVIQCIAKEFDKEGRKTQKRRFI